MDVGGWQFTLCLLVVLGLSFCVCLYRFQKLSAFNLLHDEKGWRMESRAVSLPVQCRFEFISGAVVVVKIRLPGRHLGQRLVFTPYSGSADVWRQLHVLASAAKVKSRVTDDHVLVGKVDGHKNGIPGSI